MTLPFYAPNEDPGPSFSTMLERVTGDPAVTLDRTDAIGPITHGTTIVALRTAAGVVLAGDRRATAGNLIAHRMMDKIHAADRWSAVGIAGAAGPAMEMVRLFQTELEHYEKVEGTALSLEGKANKLAQMVRAHLPAAMQGLAVVPLFAGFDARTSDGRLFTYDVTGGRYEESDHAASGSGGRDARSIVKMRWRAGLDEVEGIEIAVEALFEAADEDSATGGPDPVRGVYPQVAAVDADGFRFVDDDQIAAVFGRVIEARRTDSLGGGGSQP
ncbi:MAG TPA: proteasome subunit beta [Acidimicrobiales bacterium]